MDETSGKNRGETHAMQLTQQVCAERVGTVLRQHFADQRNAPKRMSRRWRFTPRAFQGWLYGENPPAMHNLVALMAECDALKEEVDRLVLELKATIK